MTVKELTNDFPEEIWPTRKRLDREWISPDGFRFPGNTAPAESDHERCPNEQMKADRFGRHQRRSRSAKRRESPKLLW